MLCVCVHVCVFACAIIGHHYTYSTLRRRVIWLYLTQLISLYAILLRKSTWGLTLGTVSDDLYCDDMQSVILVTTWVIDDDSCI